MFKAIGATVIALAIAAGAYIAGAHAGTDRAARESRVTHSIIGAVRVGETLGIDGAQYACRRNGGGPR